MTLEKTAPSLGLPDESFITNSPNTAFLTLPRAGKYPDMVISPKLTKDGLPLKGHRVLSRTVSDNTFLTRNCAVSGLSSPTSSTADNMDYGKEKKSSFKKRHESGNSVNIVRNQHSRLVRNFSAKELSSFDSKKDNLLSGAQFSERGSRSSLLQSSISHNATCGEILLDFPCSSDQSSLSSIKKRPEKNKDFKSNRAHRGLQHSLSMPGLIDDLAKDGKSNTTYAKTSESKYRPFFQFFRKRLTINDRSFSPLAKSNPQSVPRRRSSNPCLLPQPISKSERTPSPSTIDRRSSNQSVTSSRLAQASFPSTQPCTPTSYRSITSPAVSTSTSPTSVDKLPYYMSRSKSQRRRETRSNTLTPEIAALQTDHLTLDDLPVHPSIYKRIAEKTNSYPNTPVLRQRNNRMSAKANDRVNNTSTGSRRNSMPETYDEGENTAESYETDQKMKESPVGSGQKLRRKSGEESSGRRSSEEIFQIELKTQGESQKRRGISRSQSVPRFGDDIYLPGTDIRVISDAEDFEYNPTDMSGPINLSLCGCGFLGMYHLGVVSCLAQRAPSFVDRIEKVGGASAGAMMAAVLVTCSDKIEESAEHIQSLAKEIRKKPLGPLTPGYNFTRSVRYMLDDILPQDAHEKARDRLFVSVTNADTKKNEMLTDFTSRDELIEALVASCYIPVYAGIKLPTIRGKKYTDGGISNNMPKFETGRTITVSPFDGKSDIRPKLGQETEKKAHFINVQNQDVQVSVNNIKKGVYDFFPPKRQALQDFFEKGRYDANRFLIREGLYEIATASQKKAVLYESSV